MAKRGRKKTSRKGIVCKRGRDGKVRCFNSKGKFVSKRRSTRRK